MREIYACRLLRRDSQIRGGGEAPVNAQPPPAERGGASATSTAPSSPVGASIAAHARMRRTVTASTYMYHHSRVNLVHNMYSGVYIHM